VSLIFANFDFSPWCLVIKEPAEFVMRGQRTVEVILFASYEKLLDPSHEIVCCLLVLMPLLQ
jgi:hypothetical protein